MLHACAVTNKAALVLVKFLNFQTDFSQLGPCFIWKNFLPLTTPTMNKLVFRPAKSLFAQRAYASADVAKIFATGGYQFKTTKQGLILSI